MDNQEFSGRTALITGAASGIGAALVRWLDTRGIETVVAVDCDEAGLNALHPACRIERVVGDVADPQLWNDVETRIGRLDHAFINAGIADGCPLVDQDFEDWKRIQAVNLDGVFLGLRAALRAMKKCGEGKSIVLTSSAAGIKPIAGTAAYGSSKAAVAHLARIAAAEHAGDGIRINALAPGRVETPIWTKTAHFEERVKALGSRDAALAELAEDTSPLGGQFASAEEAAGQVGFLLSAAGNNITGTVLVNDAGFSL